MTFVTVTADPMLRVWRDGELVIEVRLSLQAGLTLLSDLARCLRGME